jgi:hypothetical protein
VVYFVDKYLVVLDCLVLLYVIQYDTDLLLCKYGGGWSDSDYKIATQRHSAVIRGRDPAMIQTPTQITITVFQSPRSKSTTVKLNVSDIKHPSSEQVFSRGNRALIQYYHLVALTWSYLCKYRSAH